MRLLLDTNILIRFANRAAVEYHLVRSVLNALANGGRELCFTPQNIVEFWNVCTRPIAQNGLGATTSEADELVRGLHSHFTLLPDNERIHGEWRRLVVQYSVAGAQVHDARLVAAMLVHGVSQILTFNDRDFARYRDVEVLHPARAI